MRITQKQAEDFVHFGEDHYLNLKTLKDMAYVNWGAAFTLWVPYAVDSRGLIPAIIMTLLALAYSIAVCVLKSDRIKKSYRLRFITNTVLYTYLYLILYLFVIFFVNVIDVGSTFKQDIELTVCFFVFPILNIFITLISIKKDRFNKEKPKKIIIAPGLSFSLWWIGRTIGKAIFSDLNQEQSIAVGLFIAELLLLIFSISFHSVLRLYYSFKYNIVTSINGETTSDALIYDASKTKAFIKIMKIIFKVVVAVFAIACLYGISQVS